MKKKHKVKSILFKFLVIIHLLFIYYPESSNSYYGTINDVIYISIETIQKNHFNQDDPPEQDDSNKKDDANQSDSKIH